MHVISQKMNDKIHNRERNNSIYRKEFLNEGLVNKRCKIMRQILVPFPSGLNFLRSGLGSGHSVIKCVTARENYKFYLVNVRIKTFYFNHRRRQLTSSRSQGPLLR